MFSIFLLFLIVFFVFIITYCRMADLNNNLTGGTLDPFAQRHTDFGHVLFGRSNQVGLRGKYFGKVNLDVSCKYFSYKAFQRSVQHICEMLDTLIEALTAFTVRQSQLCRQTDQPTNPKVKHQNDITEAGKTI